MPDPALDSSQRGPLLPGPGVFRFTYSLASDPAYWSGSVPQDGQPLEDFCQQMVAGVTNLPGKLVRPRWQRESIPVPPPDVDWAAVGIVTAELDNGWPYVNYSPQDGQTYMQQHESFDLATSCYGDHAEWFSGLIRDGFAIGQNRESMFLAGMGLITIGRGVSAPEIINNNRVMRVDRVVRIHRMIRRAYPILTLLAAPGVVRAEEARVYESPFEAK